MTPSYLVLRVRQNENLWDVPYLNDVMGGRPRLGAGRQSEGIEKVRVRTLVERVARFSI